MKGKILVIASAGGHLTQAMCATSMCNNLTLVSNKKNIKNKNIKKIYQIMDTQHNVFIHFFNVFYAIYVLLRERPIAVFSTGGPIALPFALVCKFLPIKFIYLDTLSRVIELSNTGKLVKKHKLFDAFYCQWEKIAEENDAQYIGKCFDILSENKYELETKMIEEKPLILVTVGTNQYDFDRLFKMLGEQPLYLSEDVRWVIQKGHNLLETNPVNGEVLDMVSRDEMEVLVKQASLVISHCGIGSINQMLSYQRNVVFVPRVARYQEFSDDHQLQIANEIGSDLFKVVLPDEKLPEIMIDDLLNRPLVMKPVDINNYAMANHFKNVFYK
jgi:UDP-N-acetylglucosamine transferase subunit ALG13